MGGRVKKGDFVIGGVVGKEVRDFFDSLVSNGKFESRSKAIGHVLTEYYNKHKKSKISEKENA